MAQQDELKVHVRINSRYQIFDLSGRLPFSIVFGLCRRSQTDTDGRSLILDTSGSAFDVPYALANGLLKLYDSSDETEVDLSSLHASPAEHKYVTLSPPSGRSAHWLEDFELHLSPIHPESDLAKLLKPQTKYVIRLASPQLGVQWWAYKDPQEVPSAGEEPSGPSETAKLVNSKDSAGKAAFKTEPSLPWPPPVDIHMKLITEDEPPKPIIQFSITNMGDKPISVQSSGHQNYLTPWGPFQPENLDDRARITSAAPNAGTSSLVIRNADTGDLAHRYKPAACAGVVDSRTDRRPKRENFTTLAPGSPFEKQLDVAGTVAKLPDGRYSLMLETLGAWWASGTLDEIFGDEERVPRSRYIVQIPPLQLASADEIKFEVVDGKLRV